MRNDMKKRHVEISNQVFSISYDCYSIEQFVSKCEEYFKSEGLDYYHYDIKSREAGMFKVRYKEYDGVVQEGIFGYFEPELSHRIKENIIYHRKEISDYFND